MLDILKKIIFFKKIIKGFKSHPLWVDNKFFPIYRFFKLQISFALGKKRIFFKWIDQLILPIEKGDTGLTGNFYMGLHEFNDMSFVIHLLKENDLFIDVGANLGSYSLLASGLCKAKSYAFEPVPKTFERLIENISINHLLSEISSKQIAISNKENQKNEYIYFSIDRGCENSLVDSFYQGRKENVSISSLDKECFNLNPVLIKIDVEGFEKEVLEGAKNTLSKDSLLAIIIEGQSTKVETIIESYGFKDVNYFPLSRNLKAYRINSNNKIWVKEKKIKNIKKRLKKAKKFKLFWKLI